MIVVIAAHPDDEVLGCGATIAKHILDGDQVHVLIMAEGLTSRDIQRNRDYRAADLSHLALAAEKAHRELGTTSLTLKDYPDNRLDSLDRLDLIKCVEEFLARHTPRIVYTHYSSDLNVDHRRVHEAVVTACRPMPGHSVEQLLFFEVASSTEWQISSHAATAFAPNWYVDISATLPAKLRALAAYESEMRPWPHARSLQALEHLARWRGASVGLEAAEAFMLGRNLVR